MNQRPDTDRLLRHWLADGPSTMPDRVVDVVADRISRQPQRRTWRLVRRLTMSPALKYGLAAAAVLVIAVVGYNLLPKSSTNVGPAGSPSPSPAAVASTTPTASAQVCDEPDAICAGPMPVGVNSSVAFQPKLTMTVPNGWENSLDKARAYTFHYNFTQGHFLQVVSQLAIPEQNAACTPAWKTGAGNSVADWVTFLTTHPGLVTTSPQPISIGGYSGVQLDVHVSSTWTARCPNSIAPAVVLWTHSGAQPEISRWIDDQQTTFRILDVADETVIIYLESSPIASDLAALNQTFAPIFASFQFTP